MIDDSYTKSLLHMNGADASTTFADENSSHTWTANGNAQIDTAQSVFGGASGLFDGTGDFLSTPNHADHRLDGGSNSNTWTIDFRLRFPSDPSTVMGLVQQFADASNYWAVYFDGSGNTLNFVVVSAGVVTVFISKSWNPAGTTWYHVAIVKNGTTGYLMFIDGTQIGVTETDTDVIPSITGELWIGRLTNVLSNTYYLNGWIDEFRISKGVARWTSDFTPPTSEYGTVGTPIISSFIGRPV